MNIRSVCPFIYTVDSEETDETSKLLMIFKFDWEGIGYGVNFSSNGIKAW